MPFLYLSLAAEKKIAAYRIHTTSGALEHLHETPVPGEPSVQGHDPGHCFLYAGMRSTGQLLSFRIDPESGRFLYAAGQDADRLTAYRIDLESGHLETLHTCETGRVPWWVHIVEPNLS